MEEVVYLGKIIPKQNFRAFVYAADGSKRLVESWEEFESKIDSGIWFSTKEDAQRRIEVEKPKRPKKESKNDDIQ